MHVKTKLLSQQNYVCRNKYLLWQFFVVETNIIFHNKTFVMTSILLSQKMCFVMTKLLSRQKLYLWQLLPICLSGCGHSQRCSFMRCCTVLLLLCPTFLDSLEIKKGMMFVDGKSLIKRVFNETFLIRDFH